MTTPVLSFLAVSRVHGQGARAVRALGPVDLDVGHGEFLAVMGPSGSGKSTLLALADRFPDDLFAGLTAAAHVVVENAGHESRDLMSPELRDLMQGFLRGERVGSCTIVLPPVPLARP